MDVAERMPRIGKVEDGRIVRVVRSSTDRAGASSRNGLVLEGFVAFSSPRLRREQLIMLAICFPSSRLQRSSPG